MSACLCLCVWESVCVCVCAVFLFVVIYGQWIESASMYQHDQIPAYAMVRCDLHFIAPAVTISMVDFPPAAELFSIAVNSHANSCSVSAIRCILRKRFIWISIKCMYDRISLERSRDTFFRSKCSAFAERWTIQWLCGSPIQTNRSSCTENILLANVLFRLLMHDHLCV